MQTAHKCARGTKTTSEQERRDAWVELYLASTVVATGPRGHFRIERSCVVTLHASTLDRRPLSQCSDALETIKALSLT